MLASINWPDNAIKMLESARINSDPPAPLMWTGCQQPYLSFPQQRGKDLREYIWKQYEFFGGSPKWNIFIMGSSYLIY